MLGDIAQFKDFGTTENSRWMWIFLSLNQNRVGVKSVLGEIMLGEDPLYLNKLAFAHR